MSLFLKLSSCKEKENTLITHEKDKLSSLYQLRFIIQKDLESLVHALNKSEGKELKEYFKEYKELSKQLSSIQSQIRAVRT